MGTEFDHVKVINEIREILVKERETGAVVNSRLIQELKNMIEGINRRLDISNGRIAKGENELEEQGKEHYVFANQLSLMSKDISNITKKEEGWSEMVGDFVKCILMVVLGAVLALILK